MEIKLNFTNENPYIMVFEFFVLAWLIGFIIYEINALILSESRQNLDKVNAYECGYDPFQQARNVLDIRFYLIAMIFIIFDLEIVFLFPWVVVLDCIGLEGFFVMCFFLFILTLGFIYEWEKGALEWV